jgi:hypothetical protein
VGGEFFEDGDGLDQVLVIRVVLACALEQLLHKLSQPRSRPGVRWIDKEILSSEIGGPPMHPTAWGEGSEHTGIPEGEAGICIFAALA